MMAHEQIPYELADALVDVGPATPPPSWCLPDAVPDWSSVACERGGGQICSWERVVGVGGSGVWISCQDEVIGGRVLRSSPRVFVGAEPRGGWTVGQAREMARQIIVAAGLIDEEAAR